MKDLFLRLLIEEDGPTAVEYAVMLMLIILAALGSIKVLGENVDSSFENSKTQMDNAFS